MIKRDHAAASVRVISARLTACGMASELGEDVGRGDIVESADTREIPEGVRDDRAKLASLSGTMGKQWLFVRAP